MTSISNSFTDLMEHVAVVQARRQREQYLDGFKQLLSSVGDGKSASLEEIRQLFLTYEAPEMPTLSSEIEAIREAR